MTDAGGGGGVAAPRAGYARGMPDEPVNETVPEDQQDDVGETEERQPDTTITAPEPGAVPDPEAGPPPEGYGGSPSST